MKALMSSPGALAGVKRFQSSQVEKKEKWDLFIWDAWYGEWSHHHWSISYSFLNLRFINDDDWGLMDFNGWLDLNSTHSKEGYWGVDDQIIGILDSCELSS